ncbi:type II toxin-antitoxin system Phd/YefM family antitoxin [uncultured Friedmanniella sp.]|uniref:type II toxin-antitoxin system Phd/YefM family antitoxin n=1 Tax=uncultured Friedmanniella sp. TaxID=335381 RepID=UPI0035CBF8E8
MRTTSLADAKNHLSEIVASAEATHERTTITKNGRPAAIVVSVADWESLEETLFWMSRPKPPAEDEEIATDEDVRETLVALGVDLPDALR